jgi:hypothetical protein
MKGGVHDEFAEDKTQPLGLARGHETLIRDHLAGDSHRPQKGLRKPSGEFGDILADRHLRRLGSWRHAPARIAVRADHPLGMVQRRPGARMGRLDLVLKNRPEDGEGIHQSKVGLDPKQLGSVYQGSRVVEAPTGSAFIRKCRACHEPSSAGIAADDEGLVLGARTVALRVRNPR